MLRQTSADGYFEPLGRWFDIRVYPWEEGVDVFFQDVTGRQQMLERLQAQEAALRASADELKDALKTREALINSLPALIAMLDESGMVLDVNDQWRH